MTSDPADYSPLEAGLRGDLAPVLVDWEREELLRLRSTVARCEGMLRGLAQSAREIASRASILDDVPARVQGLADVCEAGADLLRHTHETTERIQRRQADAKVEAFEREALAAAAGAGEASS